ncbi:hypothetical protein, partial [Selenomonas bovis]|uniref:hypothetical protein n=1 Tax=Selenomonas bovis TaxID=416586 RepID=UPI0003648FB7
MPILDRKVKTWRKKDLLAHMTDYKFRQMVKTQRLSRIQHGIYIFSPAKESDNDLVLTQQFYSQAIISMFSAADFHGLTTMIPRSVQITLPSQGAR